MRSFLILFLSIFFFKATAQIDLQTGSAQYSIPVFNYADPKSGLSHSIAINYNSGQGIKVNQLSTNVGLGWSLMAGGEIIRIQRGSAPDDQYNPDVTVNALTATQAENIIYKQDNPTLFNAYYPNGFLYKKYDINYLPKQMAFQPRFGDNDNNNYKSAPMAGEDTEQDIFIVNINGTVRDFKIGKDFSIKYENNSLWKTDIIKEDIADRTLYTQGVITKIKGFTITDESGLKYTFDKYDLDETQQLNALNATGWTAYSSPNTSIEKSNGKYIISKWVLTSVTNPITNTSIALNYTAEDHQYFADFLDQTTMDADNTNGSTSYSRIIGNSHTKTNILQQIIFPNGFKANFTMGSTARLDMNGSYPLSKIEISNGVKTIKTVTLNTAYFNGGSIVSGAGVTAVKGTDTLALTILNGYKYRLALTGISIVGLSPINYAFNYYIGNINNISYSLPSRMSKQRDFSGLYNPKYGNAGGATVPDQYGYYPTDDGNTEITGLMKDIQTSTSNKISYSYKLAGFKNQLRAVLVDKITSSDLVTNTNYTKAYGYCGSSANNCLGTAIAAFPAFYNKNDNTYADVGGNMDYNRIQYNPSANKKFGNYVVNGLSTQVSSFFMNRSSFIQLNAAIAQFFGCSPYTALAIQIVGQEVMNVLTGWLSDVFSNHDQFLNYRIYYDHLREEANPLPLTLAFVNEYDVVGSTNILRKTYYYNTAWYNNKILDNENGQSVYPVKTFTLSGMQRVKPGLLGNLAEVDYFDTLGNTVYAKSLTYTPNYQTSDNNFLSVFYLPNQFYSGSKGLTPYSLNSNAIQYSWIDKTAYNFVTGNNYLTSQTETVKNSNNSATTTTTLNYSYDAKNNQPNQAYSTSSDGKIKGTNTYYAIDFWDTYTSNATLSKQKQNNLVNTPVASLSWYKTSSAATTYNITSITISTYDAATLQVSSVKTSLLSQPLILNQTDINAFDPYSTTGFLTGVSFTTVQQNIYDNNLLVQSNLNDNSSVNSVVYDYNTYLPAAKISNSNFTDVSYTSFENPNKDLLSYADAGITNDVAVTPVTGNYFYKLSSGNITRATALISSQNYQVTLWAKGGSVLANGSSGNAITVKNGWTLYKFSFTGATNITISGTAYIDEVRLCPASAQMSTYTYDPVVGVTSVCDENNNISYNEYDAAGRLIIVRNADRNILKRMCYNSTGTSTACNDNGNAFQSKDFYAACPCGKNSGPVAYQVPADKYHSFISQEDADAQAWNEINTNGQSFANSHPNCSSSSAITLSYDNTGTNSLFNISVYNTCTGQSVNTSGISAHNSGTLAVLQPGEYNIQVSATGGTAKYNFQIGSPYLYQGNTTSATFSGVKFTSNTTLSITLSN